MKKAILSFLLVGAVLCASPVDVTLSGAGNGTVDSTGRDYVGPYTLTINGVATQAMCMNDLLNTNVNDNWFANVTAANSSDLSNTYLGNSGSETIFGTNYTSTQIYKGEAYLFSLLIAPGADQANIQEAAWYIMDPSNPTYGSIPEVLNLLINAANNSPNFDASGFSIISDVNSNNKMQEFMVAGDPTATPEPASIALLGCGLLVAGAARLRLKKSKV